MPLDHGYTCPSLDKLIDEAKDVIHEHVTGIVLENNPFLDDYDLPDSIKTYIKDASDAMYEALEDVFEGCRTINEDIRACADRQIDDLESRVEDLEYELKGYENE